MEKVSGNLTGVEEQIELPPGFRFHPSDEELITHYLSPKVLDSRFSATAMGEVDLNKVEPWDLPWRAKMGEREWYFFCVRDRKYPTGMRTNRATNSGYWKATGKDKEIYKMKTLVGMKKTLVFYKGRAPKGEKTNWVMHEYRLEGKFSLHNLPKSAKEEWVICRIFHKSSGGKKVHISGLVRKSTHGDDELEPSNLPPLMDYSGHDDNTTRIQDVDKSPHRACFSEQMEDKKPLVENFNKNPLLPSSFSSCSKPSDASPAPFLFPRASVPDSLFSSQFFPNIENFQYPDSGFMQDPSIMDFLLQKNGPTMERYSNAEFSTETGLSTDLSSVVSNHEMGGPRCFDDQEDPINSAGPVDLDCLWNIY